MLSLEAWRKDIRELGDDDYRGAEYRYYDEEGSFWWVNIGQRDVKLMENAMMPVLDKLIEKAR